MRSLAVEKKVLRSLEDKEYARQSSERKSASMTELASSLKNDLKLKNNENDELLEKNFKLQEDFNQIKKNKHSNYSEII